MPSKRALPFFEANWVAANSFAQPLIDVRKVYASFLSGALQAKQQCLLIGPIGLFAIFLIRRNGLLVMRQYEFVDIV